MNPWKGFGPANARTDVGVTDATSSSPSSSHSTTSSVLTYEPYYGLRAKPFSLSTDPRTLYKSSSHAPVFEELLAAIRRREGLIVLTGDMGTGKTTLCRAAIYQLDRKTFTTFVPDPYLSREDLLRMLLVGFGEVSVHDLKQGRLKGTPRADLGVQLYEFLTSLESVDAFAALVIDEAQNLSAPLLDEIRALSEMEAGRRLLQIVLVGQPDLRSRLRRPEMQKIAQRVTTVCEIRPMSREGVAGYVSHRLAAVGGTRDRVEFSAQALDLVFSGSAGIPRLVNRICDRALLYGHVDRTSQIGLAHVGRALHDMEMAPSPHDLPIAPPVETVAPAVETVASAVDTPGSLFVKTPSDQSASSSGLDLTALLSLPTVTRRTTESSASARIDRPTMTSRRPTKRRVWWRRALKSLSLPALGMGVMLFAGGIAVSTAGKGTLRSDLPPLPASALVYPAPVTRPVAVSSTARVAKAAPAQTAAVAANSSGQTWIVQVAAFASQARSTTTVQDLTDQGLPAYQVDPDDTTSGLTIVRVGPFRSAREADDVRDLLREMPDYEGAFVRNITTR
jgi:general secretion pathway protein A